jgi:uncharacterized protein YjbI with pentapeptide repeats
MYKNETIGWKCPYEALEDSKEGFCIFHEKRKDKDIEKFNEGIKKILEDKDSDSYHFEGFLFRDSLSFRGFKFTKSAFFNEAEFSGEITDFSYAQFLGEYTDFGGAKFSSKNTDFSYTAFSRGSTDFRWVIFSGESTDFFGAKFSGENTEFSFAEFSGRRVSFYYSEFLTKTMFDRTIFKAEVNFTGVDLRKCIFTKVDLKNVDFNLLQWDWKYKLGNEFDALKIFIHRSYFQTSEIYRQLKVQFHNKRDFAKAGMFHFREQECKRKACELPKDFFKWLFLWILRLSCGYGEKLRNVGLTSVTLIFLFAFGYMFVGLHNADESASLVFNYNLSFTNTASITTILKDFWTSLVFSVKGFFPLWRFQQYKVVGDFANLVAGIEFLLGAFMVGLFVYVFRRRMDK